MDMIKSCIKKPTLTVLAFSLTALALSAQAQENKYNSDNEFYDKSVQPLSEDEIDSIARKKWLDNRLPFSSSDVKDYIKKSQRLEKSFKTNLNTKLEKKSVAIDLDDPQTFPEIITATGFDSVVTFLDASGNPWPIEYFRNGNKNQFDIEQPKEISNKNILYISSKKNYARTNLTVVFQGEDTPVIIQVATSDIMNSDQADGRVSIRLQKRGPMSDYSEPVVVNSHQQESIETSNVLLKFLDNLPPKEAFKLDFKGDKSIDAWSYQGDIFVRTKNNLIWPPTESIQYGEGEVKVYKTTVSPIIRLSIKETGQRKDYKVVSYGG